MDLDRALELARAGRAQAEQDFIEELRIPSVSTLPEHRADVRRNAEWLRARMEKLGMRTELTDVLEGGHPVLLGEWMGLPGAPTLTIYGHYDVQPADPLEEWDTPPFEPVLRDGLIYARGSSDNKGNHLPALKAAEYAFAAGGPPLNLRFLIEGEEEIGGPSLPAYLKQRAGQLKSDYTLIWDGGTANDGRPVIVTGLRGILYVEIHADGASVDLHSGGFGGVAPNPINTIARLLGELKDRDGRVTIPGFYDGVEDPDADESADWDRTTGYEENVKQIIGAAVLEGESDYPAIERASSRPTLDVNGIIGGFTGEGTKTVIPRHVMAKVSMRLVPGQDPSRILETLKEYVGELTTPGVRVEVRELGFFAKPVTLGYKHKAARSAEAAFEEAFGVAAVRRRMGGSVPVTSDFQEHVGGEIVCSGLAQPGSGAHGPNEKMSLDNFHRGTEMLLRYMDRLARAE